MAKTSPFQPNGQPCDLTPATVFNWGIPDKATPVLIVNPAATLHQRAALAWSMAYDTLGALEAIDDGLNHSPQVSKAAINAILERARQLETLLEDLGTRTLNLEGGAK